MPTPAQNEAYWRAKLAGHGNLQAPKSTIGTIIEEGVRKGLVKAGVKERPAARFAKKAIGAFNDLTPVGNVTGAEEGAETFKRGMTKGDLRTAALGAATFALSVAPLPSGAKKPVRKGIMDLLHDNSGAIRAWHGSPHDFDKFEWSPRTRGTGEGAQAYGDGLYFAENRNVAADYRDTLASPLINGREMRLPEMWAWGSLNDAGGDIAAAAAKEEARVAAKRAAGWAGTDMQRLEDRAATLRAWRDHGVPQVTNNGRLYEVNINAEPEDFLDWDAPLSGQSDSALKAANQIFDPGWNSGEGWAAGWQPSGSELVGPHRGLEGQRRAEILRQQGIPGIRFLDQGSRGAGQGTSNYVVFDDSLIDILRKY